MKIGIVEISVMTVAVILAGWWIVKRLRTRWKAQDDAEETAYIDALIKEGGYQYVEGMEKDDQPTRERALLKHHQRVIASITPSPAVEVARKIRAIR